MLDRKDDFLISPSKLQRLKQILSEEVKSTNQKLSKNIPEYSTGDPYDTFLEIKEKILRTDPTEEEKEVSSQIQSTLQPIQQKAIDALQQVAAAKGGAFLLVDEISSETSIDDFVAGLVQDWDDSDFQREKGLLHVLSLKKSDFDPQGDFEFPSPAGLLLTRGGLDYHQPNSNWIRVGLRVATRYDGGNDDWLKSGNKNEWAVGFHGSDEAGTRAISQTRNFKVDGNGQRYRFDIDANELSDRKGQPCGKGAYFGAKVEKAEEYSKYKARGHKVVIQVRIKPDKVRIPSGRKSFRIVNDPEFIRPYGLCLKMKRYPLSR
ncbi:uncharacterized protein LOC134855535 [Symsagittifera roscoffensis]|uniref:uncharacterized protein LOC134855535 n=1 Tax=Symsagittifera roscoffensis TaxID=84072 RepID=UPI00307BF19F